MTSEPDARAASLAALLEELGAQALVVLSAAGDDPDRSFYTYPAKLGEALVVAPTGKPPRLGYFTPMERGEAARTGLELLTPEELDVARWAREASSPAAFHAAVLGAALLRSGVGGGRIAVCGHLPFGLAHEVSELLGRDGWSLVSGAEALRALRKCKSRRELAEIERVAGVTCEAFGAVARLLAASVSTSDGALLVEGEPLSVARLKVEIARIFAGAGLEQPRGNIVAPGGEGGVPHNAGTAERILRAGETIVVDLFPRGGLFADCTRTFCVGEIPAPVAAAHSAVRAALALARREARPGVRGWDLQVAVCDSFRAAGYATPISDPGTLRGYVHGLGHGVGFELHELPTFKQAVGSGGDLALGDVITLEPGLYDPDAETGFGVRLEDLCCVESEGVRNLTPLPEEMNPRAWG